MVGLTARSYNSWVRFEKNAPHSYGAFDENQTK